MNIEGKSKLYKLTLKNKFGICFKFKNRDEQKIELYYAEFQGKKVMRLY